MHGRTSRAGFTLVEVLVATGILTIVVAQVVGVIVPCVRLFHGVIAQCELPLRTRELREKLLFHMRPPEANKGYGGLLSVQSIHTDTVAVNMVDEYVPIPLTLKREGTQSHRLFSWQDEKGWFLMNDHLPHVAPYMYWLRTGGMYQGGSQNWEDVVERRNLDTQNRLYVNLQVSAGSIAGLDLGTRAERVIVPLFGREQQQTEVLR